MLSFLRFCRIASLFIAASLAVVTAVAAGRAAPANKVPGKGYFAEPPPSSQIEVGREIPISEYYRAQFKSGDGELRYCQLHSATVTFLEKSSEYVLLQVKVSGNIAHGTMQACVGGTKVAMATAEFDDMIRSAEGKVRRANQEDQAKKSLLELFKK